MNKHDVTENQKKEEPASIFRTSERSDYKLEPARGLDIFAAIISFVAAVIVWIIV